MRRVALIYNPFSGMSQHRRAAIVENIAALFEASGVQTRILATTSPGSAATLALQAAEDGCDTVIACGGDGTIHEAMQGLIGHPTAHITAIGVIPMGTANALAADLGLPNASLKAAQMLLHADPIRMPVGRILFHDVDGAEQSRYFIVAAGVGVDAHFFSQLDPRLKHRFGYAAYMVQALRLWATHTFSMFSATFTGCDKQPHQHELSQLLAVRIGNFGGMVRKLVPGAALGSSTLRIIAFKTTSRLHYLRFMIAVWFARHTYAHPIDVIECTTVDCRDLPHSPTRHRVEADGELLGYLPARIKLVPDALTLLVPQKVNSHITDPNSR
ncbi:MAG TPA: YegS/Rv2252/BmrU family lipid kinase [Acidobacteriaceae bacterium]|nr:YegS/Rv2252/BmrU family lipid kinase [Acidobacteriaceae bacterium]